MMASSLSPAPTGIPPVESAEAVVYLTKEEVDQIKSALPGYTSTAKVRDEWKTDEVTGRQALKLNGHAVSAETFQFPELHDKLRQVTQEINQGRGYVVIRGLDQADLSATDQIVVFLGLASHIGGARGLQNEKGHVLVHVTDSKNWDSTPQDKRHGIHGNGSLPFHNDMGTDIIALQVRQPASKGGATFVSPASGIYEELSATDPHTLEQLSKPDWPIRVSGQESGYILAPLLAMTHGQVVVNLDLGRLGLDPQSADLVEDPESDLLLKLSEIQRTALTRLNEAVKNHATRLDLRKGDILFINNWTTLHARDAFDQAPKPDVRRHLVRLWLTNPNFASSIPENMKIPRNDAFGYLGRETEGDYVWHRGKWVEPQYPIDEMSDYEVPKYTAGSAAFVGDNLQLPTGMNPVEL